MAFDLDEYGNRIPPVRACPTPPWRLRGKMAPAHKRWDAPQAPGVSSARQRNDDPPTSTEVASLMSVLVSLGRATPTQVGEALGWSYDRALHVLRCAARRATKPKIRSLYNGIWTLVG